MSVLGLHNYRGKEVLCSPADECVTRTVRSRSNVCVKRVEKTLSKPSFKHSGTSSLWINPERALSKEEMSTCSLKIHFTFAQ